jgi:hypothetical protein
LWPAVRPKFGSRPNLFHGGTRGGGTSQGGGTRSGGTAQGGGTRGGGTAQGGQLQPPRNKAAAHAGKLKIRKIVRQVMIHILFLYYTGIESRPVFSIGNLDRFPFSYCRYFHKDSLSD